MSDVIENTALTVVTKNPKRKGSAAHTRFARYMKAKSVDEYMKLGGTRADLRYDVNKKFVTLNIK